MSKRVDEIRREEESREARDEQVGGGEQEGKRGQTSERGTGRWRIILVCFYEKTDQVRGFYRKPFHNLQFGPVYWGYTVHLVTKYSPSAFYVTEVR